jgi:hypothetical protein
VKNFFFLSGERERDGGGVEERKEERGRVRTYSR